MNVINKNIIKEIKNELIDNEIPCYVYDLNEIKQRINNVTKNMPNNFKLYYAIKANPNNAILNFIRSQQEISGFEIASSGELYKSLKHYNSNKKRSFLNFSF